MKSRGKLHSTRGLARACSRDVSFSSMTGCSTSDLADGEFGDDLCLGDKTNYVSLIFVLLVDFRIANREPM